MELSSGGRSIAKTRQGGGKNLRRQHSQANQKYYEYAPSVSCGAHSGSNASPSFLEISVLVTVELAKAESKPRDQQKRPTKRSAECLC